MATPPLSRQRPSVQAAGIRRSFTQPPRTLSFHEKAGLDPSDSAANILYSHPRARIVSFTPPTDAVRSVSSPGSTDLDYPIDTIETLPWASSNEEVLASGSLIIEKIRGSTNFLKSGNKPLHALMRNSQCWCVDGEATLVMRVGPFKYNRIELPYTTEEDKTAVQRLKDVLKRILRFEATPCPFIRGFHVDLPESATTPRKKGPWKRRPGSLLSSPNSTSPSPLNLKRTRPQTTPKDLVIPSEVEKSQADVEVQTEDGLEDGLEDSRSMGSRDDGVKQINTIDEGSSNAMMGPDARNGRYTPDPLQNLDLVTDPLQEQRLEVDDDAEEQLETANDQLVSEMSSPSANFPEPARAHGEGRVPADSDVGKPFGTLAADDVPSASADWIGCEKDKSKSRDNGQNHFDQQSDIAQDGSPSETHPYIVPGLLSDKEEATSGLSEQPIASDAADPSIFSDGTSEIVPDRESSEKDGAHIVEAGEVVAVVDNSLPPELQAEAPDESAQHDLRSLENLINTIFTSKSLPEQITLEAMGGPEPQSDQRLSDTVSVSSRADSFHSFASSEELLSVSDAPQEDVSQPTPLAEVQDPLTLAHQHHRRDVSEMTIITDTPSADETDVPASPIRPSTATSEDPSTPSLLRSSASDSSWPDVETPTAFATDNDLRRRTKKKRSFSPLPPSSILLTSPPQSPRADHLTGAVLQKAFNLALVKPIEFVALLVHIVARIASGATPNDLMTGDLFRRPVELARGRGNRNVSDRPHSPRSEASDEDDYDVPIRGRSRSATPMVRKDDDADSLFDLD
jgi:Inheritance of peroxisomes protein 1